MIANRFKIGDIAYMFGRKEFGSTLPFKCEVKAVKVEVGTPIYSISAVNSEGIMVSTSAKETELFANKKEMIENLNNEIEKLEYGICN